MSEWKHVTPVPGGGKNGGKVAGKVGRIRLGPTRRTFWVIAICLALGGVYDIWTGMKQRAGGAYNAQSGYFAPANGQTPAPVDLPIQNIPQETQVWCWAAVSQQVIAALKGPQATPPQCALVAMANGAPPQACCGGQNPSCVRTGTLQQIQGLIAQFGGRPSAFATPTDPMTLYNTLANGHAVILALRSGQGSGHVVVVRGMAFQPTADGSVEPVLFVNDPMAYYTQPIPFRNLVNMWESAIIVN